MKKTLITAIAVLATINMYGQGSVVFSNIGGQQVRNGTTGAALAAGTTFRVGLYYGAIGTAEDTFTMVGAAANMGPLAGYFSGGNRTVPAGQIPAGGIGQFQVRGWSSAYGSDYETTMGSQNPLALVGKSNIMNVDTGDTTVTPPGAAGAIAPLMQAFSLTPVPEPSTIGLGLLGALSLLMLRRRK